LRSRELGEGLRGVLDRAGLTGKDVARKLGWSPSDVSRILNGKRGVRETDVATFLGACSVRDSEYERLMALCREANKPGWWQQYGSRLPAQLRTYIDHEDKAVAIDDFRTTLLPGSLQTGDYARALIGKYANIPDARWMSELRRNRSL
jgi:transcriptional regulator with XRE-family HTH domain